MAWRWSVKKARKQRRQRNELPCFKNRGQGRIVEARGYPEAQTSLLFNLSSLHVSSRTNTHTRAHTCTIRFHSFIILFNKAYHLWPTTAIRPSNRFQQRGWWKCSWKGWVREKGGWGPLGNRHLDEARGREDQGGWRHATIIWVRTGYDPVAEPQTSFSRLHTHTQVLKNDAYKIGRGILSMEESRNFIVVPCRHGKWEIEFARFLWNAGPSLYSFAFLVSHASIIIGQCCHAI